MVEAPNSYWTNKGVTVLARWRGSRAHRLSITGFLRFVLPPLVLVSLFIFTGVRGIAFGWHWDEGVHLGMSIDMISNHPFFGRPYNYPGIGVILLATPAIADGLRELKKPRPKQ